MLPQPRMVYSQKCTPMQACEKQLCLEASHKPTETWFSVWCLRTASLGRQHGKRNAALYVHRECACAQG
jgi:hypothetical protein